MSSIEKSIIGNLEGLNKNDYLDYDFGDEDLNNYFKSLDIETQTKIKKYEKYKDKQKTILLDMRNPELAQLYNRIPEKQQKMLDSIGVYDKYVFLKKILKDKQDLKDKQKQQEKSTTPPMPPPPRKEARIPLYPPPALVEENEEKIQDEIFKKDEPVAEETINKQMTPQENFARLVQTFYNQTPYNRSMYKDHELEVKFGTKGVKQLTRNDYDNVIKKLRSFGFETEDNIGKYYLRITNDFLNPATGNFENSRIRTEIAGIHNIQNYCKTNDLKSIQTSSPSSVVMITKKPAIVNDTKIFPVNFNDFNFSVSYQTEETVIDRIKYYVVENWKKSKKTFRYINRVTFFHKDYPVKVDISIVKYGNRKPDRFGRESRGDIISVYNVNESNVFKNAETYDIEIEVDNSKIGPGTKFNTAPLILEALRKVIKFVLGGLQGTNFPISYPEQKEVLDSYMNMIWNEEYDRTKPVKSRNFIGPSSITLQLTNIAPIDENSNETNIRKDFVVTDKADGQRHLMFISETGKIYLISSNMDVIFTGAKTESSECFNCLLDGELIVHNKNREFINLFAAFDIYYFKRQDVRNLPFVLKDEEEDIHKCRLNLLKYIMNSLSAISILDKTEEKKEKTTKSLLERYKKLKNLKTPIKIIAKDFFPINNKDTIFSGCAQILQKVKEDRFEYITDGLIFTHSYYGVGSNEIGKAGPKTKITWEQSFKWKPPEYNTIDFLVTTIKDNGQEVIKPLSNDGINTSSPIQCNEYKMVELRCGFNEKYDGYINPCQDIIDDNMPKFVERYEEKQENDYVPKRFYPTQPADTNAGLTKIMLKMDDTGINQMFSENNEVFSDNTIVEFRYDFTREEGWRWVPLRVRYDKTSKLMRGEKEYGNSYKTCNENWKSIHPDGLITEEMLMTGQDIPEIIISEEKYYNTPTGKFRTEALKDFHNLYVKKMLITCVSNKDDTLIDYACGKAGDLPKWIAAKLSFVFGIDYSKDNLENRVSGACSRYLNFRKTSKHIPYALFVHGNSAFNIKSGAAMLNDKAKQITAAVFGEGPKDVEKLGKGVARQYGKGDNGFNISSCQFAIHYFLETPETLKGFLKNIAECTKLNGYFIGTGYDGKLVFNELKRFKYGEGLQINEDGKKIWEITKGYNADVFEDDSSSIGYKIDVYQESINQTIPEYLVNFDYLDRLLNAYGFKLISTQEANNMGLPEGSGFFSELFLNMLDEISKNKFKARNYDMAPQMSSNEKKISFLNRYFVYKKIMEVNIDKVVIELGEYNDSPNILDVVETHKAVEIAKEYEKVVVEKPKVRKLSKKILLVAATEALDEEKTQNVEEEEKKEKEEKEEKEEQVKSKKTKETKLKNPKEKKLKEIKPKDIKPKETKLKKTLIIEDSDEDK